MSDAATVVLLNGNEHKPEKWYTECACVHPDDAPQAELDALSDAEYADLIDGFEDAHTELYDGDDYLGRGCEKTYTDTRCSTCSYGGDYPDVPWPCGASAGLGTPNGANQ